ncbi:MAG: hypothetical protein QF535_07820, partial [Anaerolineales bacterium]|nr:hypothetical protein [Anaerolineales bacterium]
CVIRNVITVELTHYVTLLTENVKSGVHPRSMELGIGKQMRTAVIKHALWVAQVNCVMKVPVFVQPCPA